MLDGLVGGWLPALRFVYPENPGDWAELVIYAPMRVENGNPSVQPVWYRVSRIEGNTLRWVRYFDSYHPFPPRMEAKPERFYEELLMMRAGWERALGRGMQIDIPDQRLADLARHSLVREMMTRIRAFPKYGVFDRSYGGSEHDDQDKVDDGEDNAAEFVAFLGRGVVIEGRDEGAADGAVYQKIVKSLGG